MICFSWMTSFYKPENSDAMHQNIQIMTTIHKQGCQNQKYVQEYLKKKIKQNSRDRRSNKNQKHNNTRMNKIRREVYRETKSILTDSFMTEQ